MAVIKNGKAPGHANGKSKTTKELGTKTKPRRGYMRWSLALIIRLCIWYTVLTPFLHCPSNISELSESSSRVCKPYLVARSHLEPHINPYYQAYAAPYVELARPYAQILNERIYTPSSRIVKHGYETYGVPALEQAGRYGHRKWDAVIMPQLNSAQIKANDLYKTNVEPHIQQITLVVNPYYDTLKNKAFETNRKYFLPLYVQAKSFISQTYASGQNILSATVSPLAQKSWSSLSIFVKGTVWPSVAGLYSENVEPQLVKIGERLATYREGRKLRAVVEGVESSVEEHAVPTPTSVLEDVVTSVSTSSISTSDVAEPRASLTREEVMAKAQAQIASDLHTWQEKFAAAADKGVEDLGERIQEIVSSQLDSGAKTHGESLLGALQAVVDHESAHVKAQINTLISSLSTEDAPQEVEKATEDLLAAIRSAGLAIRGRAQALREWYNNFEGELIRRVMAASESTLDVLDGIRDLGLQEVGMRWAWMDGVTYKDWAKYHAVRRQFDDWRDEVHDFGLHHEKVEEARAIADDILSRGMIVAENAAKELTRLKEVGKWKIEAREVSDNFDTRTVPPPPRVKHESDTTDENITQFDEESQSAVSETPESSESSNRDIPHSPKLNSQNISSDDNKSNLPSEELSAAEETLDGGGIILAETDVNSSNLQEPSPQTQSSSHKVWGGAAAQVLANKGPILDDMVEDEEEWKFSEQIQSLASEAGDHYAEATKAVSDALFGPSSTPSYGEKATSAASEQYSRALSAASSVLYGTTPSPGDQFTSAASEKYQRAVSAASSAFYALPIYATKTTSGPLESISSIASSRLQEGLSIASAQYASLKASVSPTPTSAQDPIFLDAQRRYYEAVGLAHDQYTAFVRSASSAVWGTPTSTPFIKHFQNSLDEARSQYSQVSSLASSSLAAVITSASSAIGSINEDTARGVIDDASSRYSAAMSAASKSLSLVSASASSAVYGTPTGTLKAVASKASENWESFITRASEQVYGAPVPYMQQIYNQQLARYEALENLVSELVVGKEPGFTDSVMSRLRSAYETPNPAAALSSASSYTSDTYQSVSSLAAARATPLPVLEDILDTANQQLNSAVDAASAYLYGTSKGTYEQATSAAADAYSSASSHVSEAVYGSQPSYVEAARSRVDEAFSSAQGAISTAIYGTPTGPAESAFNAAGDAYASATSAVVDNVSAASSMINSAYSGINLRASAALQPEQLGALESATSKLAIAVESAQARIASLASKAGDYASTVESDAASVAEEYTSSISSATSKAKDEL